MASYGLNKPKIVWRGNKPVAYYEAARKNSLYKQRTETGDADTAVIRAGKSLRQLARHLDQNHDIVRGILTVLIQNTIGSEGITVEPQPRDADGRIVLSAQRSIRREYDRWMRRPEATWSHDWPSAQRLLARSLYRDGEAFVQHLRGNVAGHQHGYSAIPYSVELIESDLVPIDYHDTGRRILSGVERSEWNRPIRYYFLREHPGSAYYTTAVSGSAYMPVDAARIMHPKLIDRIDQTRGVSLFASVMLRLDDLKDYEESERIAAKVAASMAAYIKKGAPDEYNPNDVETDDVGNQIPRDLQFRAGMVFDDLRPGEDIGTIDTSRPNTSLLNHRQGQLKAIAAGTNVSYSSAAKSYDGTYSAQRQELVEQQGAYHILASEFINAVARPAYEEFINGGITGSASIDMAGVDPSTIYDALYIPPSMPWIDPKKEIESLVMAEQAVFMSAPAIIRRLGQKPADVLEQEAAWRQLLRDAGIESSGTEGAEIQTNQTVELQNA